MAIEHSIKGYHFFKITEDILDAEELSYQLDKAIKMLKETFFSITARPETHSRYTEKKIRTLIHYRHTLEKKYSHVNRDVQQFLNEKYDEYIRSFNTYLPQIRDFTHYGITSG